MAGNWIQSAIRKPGALRKFFGVKKGKKIPYSLLLKYKNAKGKLGRRVRLALAFKKMNR